MRLVAGIAAIAEGAKSLPAGIVAILAGALVLAGLWTPIAAALVAILGVWKAISQPGEIGSGVLLSAIGAAMALLGPGMYSVDAKLFGWKRIDLGDRR